MAVVQKEVQGFIQFLSKGNVVDLAVATIVGGSFSSIVDALTKDVLRPVLDLLTPTTMQNSYLRQTHKTLCRSFGSLSLVFSQQ